MKRGKSVTKDVMLETLKLQGIDYNAQDGYYFCRHCEMALRQDNRWKAQRHARSQQHLRMQSHRRQLQEQNQFNSALLKAMNDQKDQIAELIQGQKSIEQAMSQARMPNNLTIQQETQSMITTTRTNIVVKSNEEQPEIFNQPPMSTEYEAPEQPEFNEMPATKPKWQTKLALKRKLTASAYQPHIEAFIKAKTDSRFLTQPDIDDYFATINQADERKPEDQRESEATKGMRKSALTFYLKEFLKLDINFTKYKTKSTRTEINPHVAFSDDELHELFEIARNGSKEVFALIALIYKGALRIQDAIGLTFGSITQPEPDDAGHIKLRIKAKKSSARSITIDQWTVDAVKAFQEKIRASDSDVMFPPGNGKNPANKWTQKISKFYAKHGKKVMSHDFRATQVTNYYKKTKDIVLAQQFVGHSSVLTTRRYIKLGREEQDKTIKDFLIDQRSSKRQKTGVTND